MKTQTIPQLSREEIAVCAFLIWEKEGCPSGREIAHWLQSEKQLLVDCYHENGVLRFPVSAAPAKGPRQAKKIKGTVREVVSV